MRTSIILATGDIAPDRDDADGCFVATREVQARHRKSFREIQVLAEKWEPDFDSLYNFPEASKRSMMARFTTAGGKIVEVSALPLWIDRDAVPRLQARQDPHFDDVLDYLRDVTREAGLNAVFTAQEDRILLGPGM